MKNYTNAVQTSVAFIAVGILFVVAVFAAPQAHAADMDFGGDWVTDSVTPFYDYGYGGGDMGGSWVTDSVTPYYDYGYGYGDSSGSWVTDSVTPFYDYSYSSPSFYGGSTLGGGFGGFSGGSTLRQSQSQSQSQGQSQSQSSTNVNNNVNNNNVTVNVPTQPTQTVTVQTYICPVGTTGVYPNCVYPQQPTYDICPNIPGIQSTLPYDYYIQNGYCYQQNYIQPPVYPQPIQPYVTLSQVPYTGYELGPVGTMLYWSFLVLWCLVAAYLIAVKKVHNSIAAWFTGSNTSHTAPAVHATPSHSVHVSKTVSDEFEGIDPFIASQIRRTK